MTFHHHSPRNRKQMHVTVFLHTETEPVQYLQTCARIRDVSLTRLAQILINKIAEDKLTEAVLDDAGRHRRAKHERRYREHVGG
jgi:hypothetical protein